MRFSGLRRASFFGLGVVAVVLFWGRNYAHGIHNAFNPAFWSERLTGKDLYDPATHYLRHGQRDQRVVALTFDDGPHPASAEKILDILREKHVHATFFLVGSRIKEHPEIVRRMIAEGHEVGNHTQDHLRLPDLRPDQVRNEIEDCETNFQRAVPGHKMELFRPPGMRFNPEVTRVASELGYTMVGWSEAAKDFISVDHRHADPALVKSRIVGQVENGSIILLHDIPTTAEVLADVLDEIERKGYRFVTVSEMLDGLK